MNRRDFFKTSTGAIAASVLAPAVLGAAPEISPRRSIRKAIMWATVGMKGTLTELARDRAFLLAVEEYVEQTRRIH